MSDPGDEYQQFFDAIRTAYKQLDDARAGFEWARYWDPIRSAEMHQRLERARSQYSHAVDELVAYILH